MGDEVEEAQAFWLFGYGSLIWKPPPHYDERVPGYIQGYVRRFWQASEDHRGTPEAPGRVVTLIDRAHYDTLTDPLPSPPNEKVWGAAYHIPAKHSLEMREYLDIREINGYTLQDTTFHPGSSSTSHKSPIENVWVYIGLPENPQFMGPQDPDQLARHILASSGPSGENWEYLFELGEVLEGLSEESGDEHVRDLMARCRRIMGGSATGNVLDREGGDRSEEMER